MAVPSTGPTEDVWVMSARISTLEETVRRQEETIRARIGSWHRFMPRGVGESPLLAAGY